LSRERGLAGRYLLKMSDQEVRGIPLSKRVAAVGMVLMGDAFLLLAALQGTAGIHLRGELCDGASVWCDGGEPTPAEWLAEMNFRSVVVHTTSAVVALILLVSAVVAWRRGRRDIALAQIFAVLLVAAFAVSWSPLPTPV
jgi:hypothetical protein